MRPTQGLQSLRLGRPSLSPSKEPSTAQSKVCFPNIVVTCTPTVSFPQDRTPTGLYSHVPLGPHPQTVSVGKHKLAPWTGHKEGPGGQALCGCRSQQPSSLSCQTRV